MEPDISSQEVNVLVATTALRQRYYKCVNQMVSMTKGDLSPRLTEKLNKLHFLTRAAGLDSS